MKIRPQADLNLIKVNIPGIVPPSLLSAKPPLALVAGKNDTYIAPAPIEAIPSAASANPKIQKTVLIVDDEPSSGRPTKIMLGKFFTNVLFVTSPEQAFEILSDSTQTVDILLTDFNFGPTPSYTGAHFARDVAQKFPHLKGKIAIYSGNPGGAMETMDEIKISLPLIKKPFSINELLDPLKGMAGVI